MPNTSTQNSSRLRIGIAVVILLAAAGAAAWFTQDQWLPTVQAQLKTANQANQADDGATVPAPDHASPPHSGGESNVVKISSQARNNLGLTSAPIRQQDYWRKIETTGVIIDRPGFTDQGVTAQVDCFVSKIHAYEGDIVRPGEKLFTLRLTSQYLQQTQSDYFKALRETEIINTEISRLTDLADRGIIPKKRIIQLNQDLKRQQVKIQADRQDLIARGLGQKHLEQIANGNFIKTIDVLVPEKHAKLQTADEVQLNPTPTDSQPILFELQELKVELGEKSQAGQILCVLADHNHLYINGHGFKKEAASIAQAAETGSPLDVEFIENAGGEWPQMQQPLKIRHLSNTVDMESRTFDFFIPLTNQSRSYSREGKTFVIWRFRPGQRVRIQIPAEKMTDVFVLPSAAIASEGPDTYVFQQNGELFNRLPVHVLFRDRNNTVIANDGGIRNGYYIASNSGAALNRILKAQSASGENTAGFHVHADGSVHANH